MNAELEVIQIIYFMDYFFFPSIFFIFHTFTHFPSHQQRRLLMTLLYRQFSGSIVRNIV